MYTLRASTDSVSVLIERGWTARQARFGLDGAKHPPCQSER